MGITASMTIATGAGVVSSALTTLSTKVSAKLASSLLRYRSQRACQEIFKKMFSIRLVKTFISLDKPIDIESFYVPLKLSFGKNSKIVSDINEIPGPCSVISGIAGQGKSMMLRMLCVNEMKRGLRIPLFIELRKCKADDPLAGDIERALKAYGLDFHKPLIDELMSIGAISLYLDGFDEVETDSRAKLLQAIEELISRHPKVKIIISSRPESGIEGSPFGVFTFCELEHGDHATIINKILEPEHAKDMLEAIAQKRELLDDLLCTPLMVTLLVITYRSYHKIPDQIGAFYEDLFTMLLDRHDGLKRGYVRRRKVILNNGDFRRVFEALCMSTKGSALMSYKLSDWHQKAKFALRACGHCSTDEEKFTSDIIAITCLIIRDGIEYRFIHKSI